MADVNHIMDTLVLYSYSSYMLVFDGILQSTYSRKVIQTLANDFCVLGHRVLGRVAGYLSNFSIRFGRFDRKPLNFVKSLAAIDYLVKSLAAIDCSFNRRKTNY